METEAPPSATGRLLSIDALRGFDMFWIVGGEAVVEAIARWSGTEVGRKVTTQLEHVEWEGFRFEDLIFPLFLFLVGAVLPFSLGRLRELGPAAAYRRVARRTALLFGIGLLYNDILTFDWPSLRVAGVLQRIALCYGITALIALKTTVRTRVVLFVTILLAYWAVLANVAPPGGRAGDYSAAGNLAGWVDRHALPGKIYQAYYGFGDNEGILSTFPAVATCLLGLLAGDWLRSSRGPWLKVAGLLALGAIFVGLGLVWGRSFPIIKNLWTSSFVLLAGGWSLVLLGLFYAVIDVIGLRRWAFFFVVIGANAITIYFVPQFVDFEKISSFFLGGAIRLASDHGSKGLALVLAASGVLTAKWLFLLFLYRNRLFLRV